MARTKGSTNKKASHDSQAHHAHNKSTTSHSAHKSTAHSHKPGPKGHHSQRSPSSSLGQDKE